jgi:LmbE family N-acetylglucosaminyl deacetylase|tara:strand:+ start:143 stop:766 length:624 start_codon:yes stop_codon:yes gene_type:complete
MKLFNFNKVLCLSPHPDDVEYSMLGTIIKHPNTHFELLQLAQGGDCDPTTNLSRLDEVRSVWEKSKCKNININFTKHKFIKELTEDKWINKIENYLENIDAIFLPNECDSHFEHRFISGFGPALIRNKNISLIQYYTPSTQDEWNPNLYIDVKNTYNLKINALNEFKSQNHRYYFRKDVLKSFHSDFQCSKKGVHYVEKYKILNLFN